MTLMLFKKKKIYIYIYIYIYVCVYVCMYVCMYNKAHPKVLIAKDYFAQENLTFFIQDTSWMLISDLIGHYRMMMNMIASLMMKLENICTNGSSIYVNSKEKRQAHLYILNDCEEV